MLHVTAPGETTSMLMRPEPDCAGSASLTALATTVFWFTKPPVNCIPACGVTLATSGTIARAPSSREVISAGGVYQPAESIDPRCGSMDQVTGSASPPAVVAVNRT